MRVMMRFPIIRPQRSSNLLNPVRHGRGRRARRGALALSVAALAACLAGIGGVRLLAETPSPEGAGSAAPGATGTVRVNVPKFRLVVHSLAGIREVTGENGEAAMPSGTYTLMRWTAEAKDSAGRAWQVRGGMLRDPLEVKAGEVTSLRLASPLRAVLRGLYQTNPISFRLEFSGTHGELFEDVLVDGKQPEPPRLIVTDAKGKRVADLPFKYG
jgi:hypothetical protein